jgi:hypothetical protein
MKNNRAAFSILGAALAGTAMLVLPRLARAGAELFTAEDVDNWNKAIPQTSPAFQSREPGGTRGVEADTGPSCHSIPKTDAPASPTIDIVTPTLDKLLVAPLDINLKFAAAGADGIQPSTFKVCYLARFMTIDITDKIAGKATVSADGLHVAGAQLPSGHHHLMMLISDKGGHVGHREAIFDIK